MMNIGTNKMRDIKIKDGEVVHVKNAVLMDKLFLGNVMYSLHDTIWDRLRFLFTGKSKLENFNLHIRNADLVGFKFIPAKEVRNG